MHRDGSNFDHRLTLLRTKQSHCRLRICLSLGEFRTSYALRFFVLMSWRIKVIYNTVDRSAFQRLSPQGTSATNIYNTKIAPDESLKESRSVSANVMQR